MLGPATGASQWKRKFWVVLAGLFVLTGLAPRIWAHADLLLQIDEVTRQIRDQPDKADLYLRRGDLRRLHAEWAAAEDDYGRAAVLAPGLAAVDFCRGRLCLEAGWPLSARGFLDRFLAKYPAQAEALVVRARALVELGLPLSAAQDYASAIRHSSEPGPELYIERAHVLASAGSNHLAAALQSLDEGVQRLGPLVTLQLSAIDLELRRRNFDGAVARVDRVAEKSPRKESWLTRKGEILRQAGREEEARQTFRAALAALQTLPPTRRNVPAMRELERRIQRELEGTRKAEPEKGPGAPGP